MAGLFDALNMGLQGFGAGRQRLQEQQRQQQQAALEQQRYQDALARQEQERADMLGYRAQTRADQQVRDRTNTAMDYRKLDYGMQRDAVGDAQFAQKFGAEQTYNAALLAEKKRQADLEAAQFGMKQDSQYAPPALIDTFVAANPQFAYLKGQRVPWDVFNSLVTNYTTVQGRIDTAGMNHGINPDGTPVVGGVYGPNRPGTGAPVLGPDGKPLPPAAIMGGRGSGPLYNPNYTNFEASAFAPGPMGPARGVASPLMPGSGPMAAPMPTPPPPPTLPMLDASSVDMTRTAPDMGTPDLPAPPVALPSPPVVAAPPDRPRVVSGVLSLISDNFEPATIGKDGKPLDASETVIGGQKFYTFDLDGKPLKVKASVKDWKTRADLASRLVLGRNYLIESQGGNPVAVPPMPAAPAMPGMAAPLAPAAPVASGEVPSYLRDFSPGPLAAIGRPSLNVPTGRDMPMAPAGPDMLAPEFASATAATTLKPPAPPAPNPPMFVMMQDAAKYLDVPAMQEQIVSLASSGRLDFTPAGVYILAGPGGNERIPLIANDPTNPDSAKAIALVRRIVGDNAFDADGMAMVDPMQVPKGQNGLYTAFYKGREREHTFFDPKTGTMVKTAPMTDADAKLYAQQMGLEYRYGSSPTAQANIALTEAKTADIPIMQKHRAAQLVVYADIAMARLSASEAASIRQAEVTMRGQDMTSATAAKRLAQSAAVAHTAAGRAMLAMQLRAVDGQIEAIYQRAKQVFDPDGKAYHYEFKPGDEVRLNELNTIRETYIPSLGKFNLPNPYAGTGGSTDNSIDLGGGGGGSEAPNPRPGAAGGPGPGAGYGGGYGGASALPVGAGGQGAPTSPPVAPPVAPPAPAPAPVRAALPPHGMEEQDTVRALRSMNNMRNAKGGYKPGTAVVGEMIRYGLGQLVPDRAAHETEITPRVDMINLLLTPVDSMTYKPSKIAANSNDAVFIYLDHDVETFIREQPDSYQARKLAAMFYVWDTVFNGNVGTTGQSGRVLANLKNAVANPSWASQSWNFLTTGKEG